MESIKLRLASLLLGLALLMPPALLADECMEGDCDDGFGTGFTDDNRIYEGEWRNGLPHGQGKKYLDEGQVLEGRWEKGVLVKEVEEPGKMEEE